MKKIIVDYDEDIGYIYDRDQVSSHVGTGFNFQEVEGDNKSNNTGDLVLSLIKQGLSADEIVKLRNNDLI